MHQSTEAKKLSAFSIFRNRNFSLLWVGQFVSTIGNSLTSLAASAAETLLLSDCAMWKAVCFVLEFKFE